MRLEVPKGALGLHPLPTERDDQRGRKDVDALRRDEEGPGFGTRRVVDDEDIHAHALLAFGFHQ
jgi:hypothetical protein